MRKERSVPVELTYSELEMILIMANRYTDYLGDRIKGYTDMKDNTELGFDVAKFIARLEELKSEAVNLRNKVDCVRDSFWTVVK